VGCKVPKRSSDGNPRNSPNPTANTGKTISYLTLQHERYISSLNKSSHSDFLTVTILKFRKVLILTETEVVEQIEEIEEVEMEVVEEVDSLAAVNTAGKDIRSLLDTGCLV
jgi:ribosomal protein S8